MRDADAARLLEAALSGDPVGRPHVDDGVAARVEIADRLRSANAVWLRDLPEALQRVGAGHVQINGGSEHAARFGWRRGRVVAPVVVMAVVLLIVAIPGARRTLARPFLQILESVFVGEHTEISQFGPQTAEQTDQTLEGFRSELAGGRRWFVHTRYLGMGGEVPPGKSPDVQRIETIAEIATVTDMRVQMPTVGSLGEPADFNHALLAPDGLLLAFFGTGDNEVFMIEAPIGNGHAIGFSRSTGGPDGTTGVELRTETFTVDGQVLVWDPDPTGKMPLTSALRWEADSVSYSILGRALTRDRAVEIFLSLKPL